MTHRPTETGAAVPRKKERTAGQKLGRVILIILCVLLGLLLLAGTAFFVLRAYGKKSLFPKKTELRTPSGLVDDVEEDGKTVTYKNEVYHYNEDVTAILCMGIDKEKIADDQGSGRNGQADSLSVAALNMKTRQVSMIAVSRDTMTDVDFYSVSGSYAGTKPAQICTAFSYGATGKQSCEQTLEAVRRYLFGVNISSYFAIDMTALEIMTDEIGGVRVVCPNDFNEGSFRLSKGESVFLDGKTARQFVRQRGNDVNANQKRMERQKAFISAFLSVAGNRILNEPTRLPSLYNKVKPYLISDLGLPEFTYLAGDFLVKDMGGHVEYVSIKGEPKVNDGFVEFHPDPTSVYETVLKVFYTKETSGK